MDYKKIAQMTKKISVKDFNRKQKYHCDNYTLVSIRGEWRLFLDGRPAMKESDRNFFEIVDTFTWYRELTPELYQLIGEESAKSLQYAEEKFFEQDREFILNEYFTPTTRV